MILFSDMIINRPVGIRHTKLYHPIKYGL